MGRGRQSIEGTSEDFPRMDRQLDTVGDGTGLVNANVDGSETPVTFRFNTPEPEFPGGSASGLTLLLVMNIVIKDMNPIQTSLYGSRTALENGIDVGMFDVNSGDLVDDFLSGTPIKSNADWGRVCESVELKAWGGGQSVLIARWPLVVAGVAVSLTRDSPRFFGVRINDDLRTLDEHSFTMQGYVQHK